MKRVRSLGVGTVAVLASAWVLLLEANANANANGTATAAATAPAGHVAQLEVGMSLSPDGSSAGHTVVTFLIANVSRSSCSLHVYPSMKFDVNTPSSTPMKVQDAPSRSGLPPQLFTVAPGGVASFAMIFGDAANQGIKIPAKYESHCGWLRLPHVLTSAGDWFYVTTNFNLAYSGFTVAVSPVGPGPVPPAI
jgi:hypothetical protein